MDSVKLRERTKRRVARAALLWGLAPLAAGPALAQQTPPPAPERTTPPPPAEGTQGAEGVRVFEAAFFRQYNPVTAGDMVARLPGFEVRDGEVLRGFGATAGNVLINGERPSSKVLITEQLKRIPADAVLRVELISGSASNVDVRGQTQLANVVLKAAKGRATPTNWVADMRHIQYSDRLGWATQLTHTFALGDNAELTLDIQSPNLRGRTEGFEAVRNASGALTSYRKQFGQPNFIGIQGAGTLKWRPTARDTVSLNAQVSPTWNTLNIATTTYSPTGAFQQATYGATDFDNNYTAEIAGDWEHRFSPEFSIKALALATFSNVDQDDEFRTFNTTRLINTQTLFRTTEGGERVLRGVATWKPNPVHTWEFGVEGAFNFRDTTLDIFNNSGSGPVPQALPVSDARVEEVRGEAFVTDVWKLAPQWTLETGFNFEASKITQTGDEQKEREFSYPKPRAILTWQADPQNQFRASIVRDVAQLDFAEFASSINVVDSSQLIGNPNLEPEKTWKGRAEWERRFGKRGALTLAVFHDQVEDVQDFIPRTVCNVTGVSVANCAPANLRTYDAPGNIGDGTRDGVEVRAAVPLAPLVPNAELRFSGMWQTTEVSDPLTQADRRFSGEQDWNYNVSFRQELPSLKSAWGASALRKSDNITFKNLEDILLDRPGDRIDTYFETTAIKGVTMRFSLGNIFSVNELRTRTFYAPTRASGVLLRTEDRKQKGGPDGTRSFSIRLSGTF
jgi:hypothetical protein